MIRRLLIATLAAIVLVLGCREPKKPKTTTAPPPKVTKFKGEGFEISADDTWKIEDAKVLNQHADFAISNQEQLFLLVIPQQLPILPNVNKPTALDLKRASVAVMRDQIKNFEVELQGPVNIDEQLGHTVVAKGLVDGDLIKYVTSYFTVGDRGFQIVAWGPYDLGKTLVKETDNILATITFDRPSKPSESDTGTEEPPSQKSTDTNIEQDVRE